MNNLNEIIANSALFLGLATFAGLCIWTMCDLDKDHKKPKKTKKSLT